MSAIYRSFVSQETNTKNDFHRKFLFSNHFVVVFDYGATPPERWSTVLAPCKSSNQQVQISVN